MRYAARVLSCLVLVAGMTAGCDNPLGPSVPTGATDIEGPNVETAPPAPPNWDPKDVVPQTQQQSQEILQGHLMRTLRELPAGTELDATRYGSAGHNR